MRGARKRRISACGNPPRPDGWPLWLSHFGISRDALWRGALPGQGAAKLLDTVHNRLPQLFDVLLNRADVAHGDPDYEPARQNCVYGHAHQ